LNLNIGIGYSQNIIFDQNYDDFFVNFNFGYGGDINLALLLGDVIYISVGTTIKHHLFNIERIKFMKDDSYIQKYIITTDWIKRYSMFAIRPYIGLGFKITNKSE
jgi:hypothetical protein